MTFGSAVARTPAARVICGTGVARKVGAAVRCGVDNGDAVATRAVSDGVGVGRGVVGTGVGVGVGTDGSSVRKGSGAGVASGSSSDDSGLPATGGCSGALGFLGWPNAYVVEPIMERPVTTIAAMRSAQAGTS